MQHWPTSSLQGAAFLGSPPGINGSDTVTLMGLLHQQDDTKPPAMSQQAPPAEAKPPLPRDGAPAGATPSQAAAAAAKLKQQVLVQGAIDNLADALPHASMPATNVHGWGDQQLFPDARPVRRFERYSECASMQDGAAKQQLQQMPEAQEFSQQDDKKGDCCTPCCSA